MKKTQNCINLLMSLRICLCVTLFAFASCKSCKKEVNALPDATQSGANTAGFLIDGRAWTPSPDGSGALGSKPMSGGYFGTYVYVPKNSVWLRMYRNDRTSMEFFVQSVDKAGRYPLSFDTSNDVGGTADSKSFGFYSVTGSTINDPDYGYITTSVKTGYVNFTVADPTTGSLAGIFEFEAIDASSGKTIKITDGRFDINTVTLNK
jgi:hypothetical protein